METLHLYRITNSGSDAPLDGLANKEREVNFYTFLGAAGLCLSLAACQTTTDTETSNEPVSAIASNEAAAGICAKAAIPFGWNFQSGDQRLSAEALSAKVKGKTLSVVRAGGTEKFMRNGRYQFVAANGQTYNSVGYVLYADGSRCIAYENPRYDMYVMKGDAMVLINQNDNRYIVE